MDLLLAQAEMPGWQWWSNWGIAGVLVFIGLSVLLYALREWWTTYKPHYVAKKRAETAKEESASKLFDTLREVEPVRAQAMKEQAELLRSVRDEQAKHAATCASSDRTLNRVHEGVQKIEARLEAG